MQALTNLIINAAKFSPRGSAVEVRVAGGSGAHRVWVCDQGPGIPEEFRPHLFNRFSRANTAETAKAEGAGLGLYITREIVERLGGRVGFETGSGRGTRFFIELPEAVASPA